MFAIALGIVDEITRKILRGWFGKRLARRRLEEKRRRRREAMEAVWYVTVLGAMEKSIARFDKVRMPSRFLFVSRMRPVWGRHVG